MVSTITAHDRRGAGQPLFQNSARFGRFGGPERRIGLVNSTNRPFLEQLGALSPSPGHARAWVRLKTAAEPNSEPVHPEAMWSSHRAPIVDDVHLTGEPHAFLENRRSHPCGAGRRVRPARSGNAWQRREGCGS
jgi:hypothetical protein